VKSRRVLEILGRSWKKQDFIKQIEVCGSGSQAEQDTKFKICRVCRDSSQVAVQNKFTV
jgi:hypothetical protein